MTSILEQGYRLFKLSYFHSRTDWRHWYTVKRSKKAAWEELRSNMTGIGDSLEVREITDEEEINDFVNKIIQDVRKYGKK